MESVKRLTIELPSGQHQKLKVQAAKQQTTMQRLVLDALRQHLPANTQQRPAQ